LVVLGFELRTRQDLILAMQALSHLSFKIRDFTTGKWPGTGGSCL
jgi:hypothetical protein